MKKDGIVPASHGQVFEIQATFNASFPKNFSHNDAQSIINQKGKFMKDVKKLLSSYISVSDIDAVLLEWVEFYRHYFNLEVDPSTIVIPEQQTGFDRLIIIAKGITMNQVYDACTKQFSCWRYVNDLDENVPNNDRTSNEAYTVWVRNNIEADEQYKNTSANELAKRNIPGITLLERLVLELKYFTETGSHLDITNVTLCSGSRCSGGDVPDVGWVGSELGVDWCGSDGSFDDLRCREVV